MLAEQYPSQYAGSLAMCGPLSGSQVQIQYLGDVRVLFDYYFPGVLAGDVNTVGNAIVFAPGQPEFQAVLTALIGGFPNRTIQFALAARLPFATAAEAVQGAMTAIGFSLRFTNDLLSRTHGHPFYDNLGVVYAGAADAGVGRFAASADAAKYLDHYFTPTGNLSVPTLTLHSTRDPAIPLFHEFGYADAVNARGAGSWLVQRTVTAFGHCAFAPPAVVSSFDALVAWVTGGARPAGGNVQP
jgi:hypothetical protein